MTDKPHFTTRRGFLAATGFGGTALYGLWVGYGAAPGPLALFNRPQEGDSAEDADLVAQAPGIDDFEARVRNFVSRFGEADGSVRPRADDAMPMTSATHGHHAPAPDPAPPEHGGHGTEGGHAGGQHAAASATVEPHRAAANPIDIWLQASQFQFQPAHLRLVTHQPYRIKMMATDVSHGASIQFGQGARMIRLRPGQLVETEITLLRPGEFLIYCTYFCGAGHDAMQARLSVTEGGAA